MLVGIWWYQQGNQKLNQRRIGNTMVKRTNNDIQDTTLKTKERATQTPLKTGGELRFSRRVSSSCSTSATHCVTFVTNPVISHEWRKIVIKTNRTYTWSFVAQIFPKTYTCTWSFVAHIFPKTYTWSFVAQIFPKTYTWSFVAHIFPKTYTWSFVAQILPKTCYNY